MSSMLLSLTSALLFFFILFVVDEGPYAKKPEMGAGKFSVCCVPHFLYSRSVEVKRNPLVQSHIKVRNCALNSC